MAASYLAAPGTEAGPCAEECKHTDCKQTRQWAAQPCFYCQEAIGYERGFYSQPRTAGGPFPLSHSVCYQQHLEGGQDDGKKANSKTSAKGPGQGAPDEEPRHDKPLRQKAFAFA